ncbi:MAG TPA: YihY/virulence factor BrkB family protein [Nevskia sp.]|nr:YihY/virulence factor BrkB family protein [Nevskia sp.]
MDSPALHRDNPGNLQGPDLISNSYYQRLHDWVWTTEPATRAGRLALHAARYAMALARDMAEGEITLRAMSLVYTTLLSLAPLLALAFSVLKALGVHDSLEPILEQLLRPLGDQGPEIARNIIGFVDNMKVGVLGFLGVILLLYTAVSMITKVESSFNFIWKIAHTRGFSKRFSEYLVVLMVGPMVVVAALGLTASVRSNRLVMDLLTIEPFGSAILLLTKALPYLLIIGVLGFFYAYIPNTRVRMKAAAIGGLFGGVVWQSASVAFATFVANANYKAIYSGFAIVIVLLLWVYVGWLIILMGCRLAFYVQYPRYLPGTAEPPPPASRAAEFLALRLMAVVGGRFLAGQPPLAFEDLRCRLAVPAEHLERTAAGLVRLGVLAESQPGRRLLPARDLGSYTVAELWLWSRGELPESPLHDAADRQALALLSGFERQAAGPAAPSLREWLRQGG